MLSWAHVGRQGLGHIYWHIEVEFDTSPQIRIMDLRPWRIRLGAQDIALSRRRHGFESRIRYHVKPRGRRFPRGILFVRGSGQLITESTERVAPTQVTRILLIRHGMNDYVKNGLLAGRTQAVPLNDEGQKQATALAERLGSARIGAIYSSPLERCQGTAGPLAARLGLQPRKLEDINETDCGDWTGRSLDELRREEIWQQVQINPSGFRFPNGESMFEVQARMVVALERLRREHGSEVIAVVSHCDPIKLAITYYMGVPLDLYQRLEVSPASISELEFSPWSVRLLRLNDCSHVPAHPQAAVRTEHTASEAGQTDA
jgi:probable phosphomutase (TIGR03848 family)